MVGLASDVGAHEPDLERVEVMNGTHECRHMHGSAGKQQQSRQASGADGIGHGLHQFQLLRTRLCKLGRTEPVMGLGII